MANLILRSADAPAVLSGFEEGSHQYLTFFLGGEMFAVGILHVKEIIEYGTVTRIPMMPRFIRGVINLRGSVVPVIDLSCRFGAEPTVISRRTCVVILELPENDEQPVIGVVVDAVSEVLEIARSEIAPAPAFGARIRAEFIDGMGKVKDRRAGGAERFVIVLNVGKVLATEEIALLARVAAEGESTMLAGEV